MTKFVVAFFASSLLWVPVGFFLRKKQVDQELYSQPSGRNGVIVYGERK